MDRDVQPLILRRIVDPKADSVLEDEENGSGNDEAPAKGRANGGSLLEDELAATIGEAADFEHAQRADAREDSGGQRAPGAAHAVDREDIQGVVNPYFTNDPNGGETDRSSSGALVLLPDQDAIRQVLQSALGG